MIKTLLSEIKLVSDQHGEIEVRALSSSTRKSEMCRTEARGSYGILKFVQVVYKGFRALQCSLVCREDIDLNISFVNKLPYVVAVNLLDEIHCTPNGKERQIMYQFQQALLSAPQQFTLSLKKKKAYSFFLASIDPFQMEKLNFDKELPDFVDQAKNGKSMILVPILYVSLQSLEFIRNLFKRRRASHLYHMAGVLTVFDQILISLQFQSSEPPDSIDHTKMLKLQYVRSMTDCLLPVDTDIQSAEYCGVSLSVLNRWFRQLYGWGLRDFILVSRMREVTKRVTRHGSLASSMALYGYKNLAELKSDYDQFLKLDNPFSRDGKHIEMFRFSSGEPSPIVHFNLSLN